jgi:hypothetical protein
MSPTAAVQVFDLYPYVFYRNPFNYVAMAAAGLLALTCRACFRLYGNKNRLFSKKIAANCGKPGKL